MYHSKTIDIKAVDILFSYCTDATIGSKCMYNTANFYIRNTMTGLAKEKEGIPLSINEKKVLRAVRKFLRLANLRKRKRVKKKVAKIFADESLSADEIAKKILTIKKNYKECKFPSATNWMLSYEMLDAIFKLSRNPDYYNELVSSHAIQNAVRDCTNAWKAYFKSLTDYKRSPKKYLGKPRIPKYIHGDKHTAKLSYQVCEVKDKTVKLPLTKKELIVGDSLLKGLQLIEIKIVPYFGYFQIHIVTDDGLPDPYVVAADTKNKVKPGYHSSDSNDDVIDSTKLDIKPGDGVMLIDLGLNNFAAIADNKGHMPILIKGGFLKARNQWYNKKISFLRSEQMKGHDPKVYHPPFSKTMNQILRKRNVFIRDAFFKIAHYICRTASSNGVKFIIVGKNKNWKQNINIGHKNNQEFVQIPHAMFINTLRSVSREYGIMVDTVEEAYTSKASFLDNDPIPDYEEKTAGTHSFSGKRKHRGLYVSADSIAINADINGACNIGRKYSESVFCDVEDFSYLYGKIEVVKFKNFYMLNKKQLEPKSA